MITHAPKNYKVKLTLQQIEDSPDFANLEDVVGFYFGGAEGMMLNKGPIILFYTSQTLQPFVIQSYKTDYELYLEYVIGVNSRMQDLTFNLAAFSKFGVFTESHPLYNTKTKNIYLSKISVLP